jgi:2-succinyl-5-enolpyruvyl-6-hydroxy-3-cyclohexene-1-carboxylate synthase
VRHAILSPGSRCAPLSIAFARHPDIQTRTLSDERSAAFVGLGMARLLKEPVVLVCTSGSAAYNYAPAVAEAYYQQIPLVVITADRPPEWIDQLDGQTIRQRAIYGRHIKGSYELPVAHAQQAEEDLWFTGRQVAEGLNLATAYPAGPVHINVPIREPFYPEADEQPDFAKEVKVIRQRVNPHHFPREDAAHFQPEWEKASKKLIICGQHVYDAPLAELISQVSERQQIPVLADVISNMHPVAGAVRHADVLLAQKDDAVLASLKPELLITFGLSVMSKNLKLFLRKYRPQRHWHIQPSGTAADTFQALTQLIHAQPLTFFQQMQKAVKVGDTQRNFFLAWQTEEKQHRHFVEKLFESGHADMDQPSEFQAVQEVMRSLPDAAHLHLANSMAVRYANLIGINDYKSKVEVFANRGTSGIDGSSSTAVGTALASGELTVLLTGDLAFFYDRNAFWHNYLLPNLRIVLLNNHGGGIFRMIDGPARQPELEEYFVTRQALEAENTAHDFGMDYQKISLRSQKEVAQLREILPCFLGRESQHACLLEIITDADVNTRIFRQYKMLVANNTNNERKS